MTETNDPLAEFEGLSYEELVEEGRRTEAVYDGSKWRQGDLARQVEEAYGKLKEYAESVGVERALMGQYRLVAEVFSTRQERYPLSWSHHRAVYTHSPEERAHFLAQAVTLGWSVVQLVQHAGKPGSNTSEDFGDGGDGGDGGGGDDGSEDPIYVRVGDLYQIGPHRVLCDDSGNAENVARALGDLVPSIVFTDPPYGVGYVGKTEEALTIDNDARDDAAGSEALDILVKDIIQSGVVELSETTDEFRAAVSGDTHRITVATFEAIAEFLPPGTPYYVCAPAGDMEPVLRHACETLGSLRQTLVWVKNAPVMGRQDYHWQHEFLFYGWTPGAAHSWVSGKAGHVTVLGVTIQRDEKNAPQKDTNGNVLAVLDVHRPSASREHPTSKPIRLALQVLVNHLTKLGVVLDPFCGSGSTLIAANALDVTAVGIELDPRYAQATIQRLENALQTTAELIPPETLD